MAYSIAKNKSYEFASQIVRLCSRPKEQKHSEIARQLLRAGTSIGANVEEALAGYSRKDFCAKVSVASEEAREANYWLRLLTDAGVLTGQGGKDLLEASEELVKILTSTVKTTAVRAALSLTPQRRGDHGTDSKLRTQN